MRRLITPALVLSLALATTVVTGGVSQAEPGVPWDGLVLGDGFEYGLGDWASVGNASLPQWHRVGLAQHSGRFAVHLDGAGATADTSLTTAAVPVGSDVVLSFWQRYDFEKSQGINWDGGVIEFSTDDGVSWNDLSTLVALPYNGPITNTSGNPLGSRQGFVGLQQAYTQVTVPIPLQDQSIRLRFRFGADEGTASGGWWIDDVSLTDVAAGAVVAPHAPTAVQATPFSATTVGLAFAPAGGSPSRPVVAHVATCTSSDGGVSGSSATRQPEVEVSGLTPSSSYSCTVKAWTTAGFGAESQPVQFQTGAASLAANRPAATASAAPSGAATGPNGHSPSKSDGSKAAGSGATTAKDRLAGYDALDDSGAQRLPSAAQQTALRAAVKPGTRPQLQNQLGVPTTVWARSSGPIARPGRPGERPEVAAARGYLADLAALYRLSAGDVADATVTGHQDLGRGPVLVQFGQRVNGVPVWHERLAVLMTQDLGLVGLTGYLLPRHVSQPGFALGSRDALAAAYADLTGHAPDGFASAASRGAYDRFTGSGLLSPARATKVMYRLPGGLVAAWYVELRVDVAGEHREFGYVIGAHDGRLLNRTDLVTDDNADFHYRGWVDPTTKIPYDGPQGSTAAPHPTGTLNGFQAPNIAPNLVQGPLTGDPWLDLGSTTTTGNNVDAYTDINPPDGFSAGDVRGAISSPGNFDHVYDLTQAPNANPEQANASLTQLFYDVNYLHDWFYLSGFTEAAGNAQTSNYGRGGTGGDPIHAEDMDNFPTSLNNANMSTPADGASPRMQMYVWSGPTVAGVEATPGGTYAVGLAAFGPAVFDTTQQIVAMLDATGSPTDGCEGATNAAALAGKIALVDRGTCGFQVKAQNAQDAGAAGVVIANNVAGTPPGMSCSGSCSAITIGTLSVSQADGSAIRTNLTGGPVTGHLFRSTSVQRDGSLDGGVVAHEWGHYLAHRLAPSLGSNQAQAMGEGWSDFVALLQMVQPDDVAHLSGAYAMGAFDSAAFTYPQQFYFGIRRMPYSTDLTKNGLTFKHITSGQPLPNVPLVISDPNNAEVHNAGEVWASMLWESYAALLADTVGESPRLTFDDAKKRMTDYLVASLKVTPADPTYLEARDALLLTAYASNQTDFQEFLAAFAKRGAGVGAIGPDRSSTTFSGITESYSTAVAPPTTVISVTGGTPGQAGWYVAPPVASVTVDSGLGVIELRCVLDDPTHATLGDLPDDSREPCDHRAPGAHLPEGVHTVYGAARDLLSQAGDVASVTVNVDTIAPQVTCDPAAFYTGQPGAQVTAMVADLGSGPSPAQLSSPIDTSAATAGSVPFIGHDVAGNATSVDCPYTVADDVTAPTMGIESVAGTFASGLVTVTATAVDDFGVERVRFRVDDGILMPDVDDLDAPYTREVDTTLLADGTHTVSATGIDLSGNTSAPAPLVLTVDNHAPAKPTLTALKPFTTTGTAPLGFSSSDGASGSGVASYAVQVRKASYTATGLPAPWSNLATVSGTTYSAALTKGTTYCFRVVATDQAGHASVPSAQTCTARLVDDPSLKHSTGWSKVTSSKFYGGSASKTTKMSASLTLANVHTRRLAVLATTCASCGSVKVFLGATLLKKISLVSASTRNQILIVITLPATRTGTVKLTTTSTKAVTLDGLGLSHT